jgi:hypothetical protein
MKKMKTPTLRIDLRAEIAAAWDRAWKRNLESRLKGRDYGGDTYYLTATSVEREAREEFSNRLNSCRYRILGLGGIRFLDHVRNWLSGEVRSGRLEADSRGRGHCSGMRFRPAGAPASPAEKKADALPTAERSRRRFGIVHLAGETPEGASRPGRACEKKPRKKSGWSRSSRRAS